MSGSSESVKRWRQKTKENLVKAMGGECVCCGYNKCNRSLAFHHLDPSQKDFSFGKIMGNPKSIYKIIEEVKKCVLVCHNCHSEIHAGITEVPIDAKSFDDTIYQSITAKPENHCKVCDKVISVANITCSLSCAAKVRHNRYKIDWSKLDLKNDKRSNCEIAKELGVSETAIRKRKKKLI